MEARRPTAMSGKQAAIFHNDNLYLAFSRPYLGSIAHILSLPLGMVMAMVTINHFRIPFPDGSPPVEAEKLLKYIGVDPKIGQPYARLDND